MVKSASSDLIKCLCECSMNILKGNVPISPAHKRRLSRHKKDLRFLAKRGNKIQSKKRVLQKGGLLPALLAPLLGAALPAVTGLIGSLFGKK